ncbi:MAG: hypothetical protein V2J24_03645 [Pseudomonadales bacterium]|jgi:hypothetical protein|nr:hypothetical protein [Pseudomonadales bacterium]
MSETDSGMTRTTVVMLTSDYRIRGGISLAREERVTDYVTSARNSMAVTDAEVRADDGRIVFNADFVNVHRDHVQVIAPAELTHKH